MAIEKKKNNYTPQKLSIQWLIPCNESNYTVIELMIVQWVVDSGFFQLDEIPVGKMCVFFFFSFSCFSRSIIFHTMSHILRAINRAKCLFYIRQYFPSSQFSEFQLLPHLFIRSFFIPPSSGASIILPLKEFMIFHKINVNYFLFGMILWPPTFNSIPFSLFSSYCNFLFSCFASNRRRWWFLSLSLFLSSYYRMQWLILEIALTDAIFFLCGSSFYGGSISNRNPMKNGFKKMQIEQKETMISPQTYWNCINTRERNIVIFRILKMATVCK